MASKAKRLTRKSIMAAMKAKHPDFPSDVELIAGNGYFYFSGEIGLGWTSIYSSHLGHQSLQVWIADIEERWQVWKEDQELSAGRFDGDFHFDFSGKKQQ